ncbi:MAG: hypothetical protein QGG40_18905 [Myxococcota bacterium]|nr:hypothetical protein [Myxococcota bacterium]
MHRSARSLSGRRLLVCSALVLLPSMAMAGPLDKLRSVIYPAQTVIEFDGYEVQGELVGPGVPVVFERQSARFPPMIELRREFDAELSASVDQVK